MCKRGLSLVKEFDFEVRKSVILILSSWLFTERVPQVATRLLATAYTKYQIIDSPMNPAVKFQYEKNLSVARSKLDEQTFNAAWAQGEKMEINQAIDYALSEIGEIEKSINAK